MGYFFTRDMREAKGQDFLTIKHECMSVHEYSLKFTQLYHYDPKMVADMRRRMSLFVVWLSGFPNKKGKAPVLIGDVDIGRLMIHVQQVEDDKLRDREEFKNKRVKALGNESGQQKSRVSRSCVQHKHKRPTPSSVHLHQGTKVTIIVKIPRISKLYPHRLKTVWHKGVLRLLHVLSVVRATQWCVLMDQLVASSVVRTIML